MDICGRFTIEVCTGDVLDGSYKEYLLYTYKVSYIMGGTEIWSSKYYSQLALEHVMKGSNWRQW